MKKILFTLAGMFLFVACFNEKEEIKIIHTDAMKARVLPKTKDGINKGGFAMLSQIMKENRDGFALTVDAGSSLNGSVFSFYTQGRAIIEFMNYMKYDALLIDNREFDYGLNQVKQLRRKSNFEMMSSNIIEKEEGNLVFEPYIIKESPKGNKIAILGITDDKSQNKILKEFFERYKLLNAEDVLDRYLPILKKEADIVILLSSLKKDRDIEIAKKYSDDIDLIIGRTRDYKKMTEPININGVDILYTEGKTATVGVYKFLYSKKSGIEKREWNNLEISSENYKPDSEMGLLIERYSSNIENILSQKVGESKNGLKFEQEKESEIANFIADVIKEKSGAEFAFINEGAIRDSFPKEITKGAIYKVFPFPNIVVKGKLQGKYIKEILKKGLDKKVDIIPSGIKVKYIDDEFSTNVKLENEKYYNIATTDFLVSGGDSYIEFTNTSNVDYLYSVRAVLTDYIKENTPIDCKIDNRIIRMRRGN